MEYRFGEYGARSYGGNFLDSSFVDLDFPLVGSNDKVSSSLCNVFGRNLGCLNVVGHVGKDVSKLGLLGKSYLDGVVHDRDAVVFPSANHCSDPLCPVCCLDWARRRANRAIKRFRVVEKAYLDYDLRHVVISVPYCDFGLAFSELRRKVVSLAVGLGVEGGVFMYHPKRFHRRRGVWYFAPHFHFLGFVLDGWLDGALVRDVHNLTGYVVKNLARRQTVYGTLMYQLSHAGVAPLHGRSVGYFGFLSGHALAKEFKVVDCERKPRVCPVCGERLVHVCRVAKAPSFRYAVFEECFVLDDVDNWVEVVIPFKKKGVEGDDGYDDFARSFEGCSSGG